MNRIFFYSMFIVGLCCFAGWSGCNSRNNPEQPSPTDSTGTSKSEYRNPVVTPVSADPAIIRTPEGTYYLYATQDAWADGNGAHYMAIFKSDDLVNWTYTGDVFRRIPTWGSGDFLWAPDISRRGDTYYLYYTYHQSDASPCIGLATSKNPERGWEDMGHAVFCSDEVGVPVSIDPFVWDDGQTRTIIWGHGGIYALELNEAGTGLVSENPSEEKIQLADSRFEAAYMIRHDDSYYLFVSAGNCCNGINSDYRVYVGRSESLTGPYVDAQGIDLREGGGTLILSGNDVWVGPGHNSVTTDDAGNDWIVYHAIPRSSPVLSNGVNHREGLVDRIQWQNGWPSVNGGSGPTAEQQSVPVINDN